MKKRLRWIFYSAAALIVVLGLSIVSVLQAQSEIESLRSELETFLRPNISGNSSVRLSVSTIVPIFKTRDELRLQRFAVESRVNPIFGADGVDLDALVHSVQTLESLMGDYVFLYGTEEQHAIRKALHPIDFLHALAETERKRRILIAEPSYIRARGYIEQLETSIELYIRSIVRVEQAFSDQVLQIYDKDDPFVFLSGETTVAHIMHFLNELKMNAYMQQEALSRRKRCFEEYTSQCEPLVFPHVSTTGPEIYETLVYAQDQRVSEEINKNLGILAEYYVSDNDDALSIRGAQAPVLTVGESHCFSDVGPVYYLPRWRPLEGGSAFSLGLANELFFYDTHMWEGSDYFDRLRDRGVRYVQQPATNLYMCPDGAHDMSMSATILFIRSVLQGAPLFTSTEYTLLEGENGVLSGLEDRISNGKIVSHDVVMAYVGEIRALLDARGEHALREWFSDEQIFNLGRFVSVFHQGMPYYDEALLNAARSNIIVAPVIRAGNNLDIGTLFITRGYQPTTFAVFNKSIISEPTAFFAQNRDLYDSVNESFLSYNESLSDKLSPTELLELLERAKRVEEMLRRDLTSATDALEE